MTAHELRRKELLQTLADQVRLDITNVVFALTEMSWQDERCWKLRRALNLKVGKLVRIERKLRHYSA